MELFFDLVYALAVTELGQSLVSRPTFLTLAHSAALFVPIWWAWVGYTFYADRFESDDVTYRVIMIIAMLGTSWLVVAIPDAFAGERDSLRFALSYVLVRVLLIALYGRSYRNVPSARPLIARYIVGFSAGAAIWLGSLLAPPPVRYLLWAVGLLFELAPPLFSAVAIRQVPFHRSHIPERFGNLAIVVLGEGGALGALRLAASPLRPETVAVAAIGLMIAATQWWLYFDCVDASPLRRWFPTGLTYIYGHLIVFAGLTVTGVGVVMATQAPSGAAAAIGHWTLCAGPGMYLLSIGFIHFTNVLPHGDVRSWSRLALGGAMLGFAPLSAGWPLLGIEAVILAALAGQTALELHLPTCPHVTAMRAAAD